MTEKQVQPSRRGFFMGTGAVAAVAAVTAVSTPPLPQAQLAESPKPERGGGYKISEHIQRYYRSARV